MSREIDNNFFILESQVELQSGKKIVNNSGLWLIHDDLKKVSLYISTSTNPRIFQLSDLQLTAPNDEIKSIDFIEHGQIYIFAIRNKVPTGFFIKIDEEELNENDEKSFRIKNNEFESPKVLSFALDSLYFHRQILASFIPIQGSFCIVSKEGITLHDLNFQVHFSLIHQITFCLHSNNFLYASDGIKFIIYRFDLKIYDCVDDNLSVSDDLLNISNENDENKIYQYYYEASMICKEVLAANGYPLDFIPLSSSLLIILKNTEKKSFQIQLQNFISDDQIQRVFHDISGEINASIDGKYEQCLNNSNFSSNYLSIDELYIPYFQFMNYDDCLLISDTSTSGYSILIDFTENHYTSVGNRFQLPNNIHIINIFNQDYVLCDDNCIYKLCPEYSQIKVNSLEVTSAIMRRKDGINDAFNRLREKLKNIRDNEELKEIVKKIGPSATDPIAQMKFSRLIQFSGISDPHLIVLGLVQFSILLGDKMINEAWIPLFECFAHSQIENLLDDAIRNGIIKLNASSIKNLVLAFSKKIHVDENIYSVDNLIEYAYANIRIGQYDDAKIIIILAQLSDLYTSEQIEQVKNKLDQAMPHLNPDNQKS